MAKGIEMLRRNIVTFALAFVAVLWLSLLLVGCLSFQEASEDAAKAEASIKSELGMDVQVGANVSTGTNGKTTFVAVRFKSPPRGDIETIKKQVTDIVNKKFRSHVDGIQVLF